MQSVTIAIPTHNRAELLEQTLISLAEVVVPPGSAVDLLIIVDACTDGTVAIAQKLFPRLPFPGRVVPFEFRNLNRGRNACVEQASGEIVLFLDDDVWVSPGLLDGHLEVYRSTPASIVAGHIELWWRDATRPDWMSDATAVMLTERRHEGTSVRLLRPWDAAGANFSIRRNAVIKVGGFKPGLDRSGTSLLGGGETEWIRRALKQGLELWSAPQARVKHYVAPRRVESPAYVLGVARGLGTSHVYMKEPFGLPEVARQLVGRSLFVLLHAARLLRATFKSDKPGIVDSKCNLQLCLGALSATFTRLTGKSPVPKEAPVLHLRAD